MKNHVETTKRRFRNLFIGCVATAAISFGSAFGYISHVSIQQNRITKAIKRDIEDNGYNIESIDYDRKIERDILNSYYVIEFTANNGNEYKAYYSRRNFKPGKYVTTSDYANFFEENTPYIKLTKESEANKKAAQEANKETNQEEVSTFEQN